MVGTMGAIFGSLVAMDQNQNHKSCEYLTTYNTENRKYFLIIKSELEQRI